MEVNPAGAEPQAESQPEPPRRGPVGPYKPSRPLIKKEYYSIGEACELLELKPHVLRYWESQFSILNPSKNRSGNRVYQRKEIQLLLLVKHLLYDERFTIEGAKQKITQLRRTGELRSAAAAALGQDTVRWLREELSRVEVLLTMPERP